MFVVVRAGGAVDDDVVPEVMHLGEMPQQIGEIPVAAGRHRHGVAEEARHISFAHEYLRKRLPHLNRRQRLLLSINVPIIMRVLCQAILVPPRSFFREYGIPLAIRKELFFRSPESRKWLQDMFGNVRMLCCDTGLMNPPAKLIWRICRIDGAPSRFRSEPQLRHLTAA